MPARIARWFETHWIVPAYGGWVLLGLAAFFFAAATNTLAGWLYVISGVMLGLLLIAAILPPRNLTGIDVERQPIRPVSAGEALLIELTLTNSSRQAKALLQVWDEIAPLLKESPSIAIAAIAPGHSHRWAYEIPTQRRGVYLWQAVTLRTAAPLGLFWCRRPHIAKAVATVYPQILPLSQCSLIDPLGDETGLQWQQEQSVQLSTEGITRSLRPYRWGDSTRLIHWRTSARYGELRVRELEKITAARQVIIALNSTAPWEAEAFEQAVIAAASLYIYALRRGFSAALWIPGPSLLRDKIAVLSALAGIQATPSAKGNPTLPAAPVIWLTTVPLGSEPNGPLRRQLCWASPDTEALGATEHITWISSAEPLQPQLQSL